MELRDLKTFAAVARHMSFHKAGDTVHAAQSTVSARIAALEEDLGTRLFERLGRRVALTEAGERLLAFARKMLDLEEEARAFVSGEAETRGVLTVRVPESLGVHRLPRLVGRFRRRFPRLGLRFTACTHDGLEKDLRQGVTDMAFLLSDSINAGDLRVERLCGERLVMVASPGHPLAGRAKVEAADLAGETLLLSCADCSYRRLLEGLLAQAGVEHGTLLEIGSVASLRACLALGLGVSLLPAFAAREDLRSGRLAALRWRGEPLETSVLMIWHRDKWLSPPLAAFMDLARQGLRRRERARGPE